MLGFYHPSTKCRLWTPGAESSHSKKQRMAPTLWDCFPLTLYHGCLPSGLAYGISSPALGRTYHSTRGYGRIILVVHSNILSLFLGNGNVGNNPATLGEDRFYLQLGVDFFRHQSYILWQENRNDRLAKHPLWSMQTKNILETSSFTADTEKNPDTSYRPKSELLSISAHQFQNFKMIPHEEQNILVRNIHSPLQ